MKKKHIVVIICIILATLIGIGAGGYFVFFHTQREPMTRILISQSKRNASMTSDGSRLVQIGARLYYSVDSDYGAKYGVYEITNSKIDRVQWDGFKGFESDTAGLHGNMAVHDDELCEIDQETGAVSIFDFDSGKFVAQDGLYSDYVKTRLELEKLKGDSNEEILMFAELFDSIYYIVSRDSSELLYKYTEKDGTNKALYNFSDDPNACVTDIYSSDADVYVEYITGENKLCAIRYNYDSGQTSRIDNSEYMGRPISETYAYYVNNPVCADTPVRSHEGVFAVNLATGEKTRVYDGFATGVYVIDNVHIYFSKSDQSLWRVKLENGALEQVF